MKIDDIINVLYSGDVELDEDKKNYDRELLEDVEFLFEFMKYREFLVEDHESAELSEQEKFKQAMEHSKSKKYYKMLYPNFKELPSKQKMEAQRSKAFIEENLGAIDSYFAEMSPKSESAQMTPNEQIKEAIYGIKAENYCAILHTEYAKMTMLEKRELRHKDKILYEIIRNDINIMYENIERIDDFLSDNNLDKKRIQFAVNKHKVDKYFELLYPDYAKLSADEKYLMDDTSIYDNDKNFLYDNIAAVERQFIEMQLSSDEVNMSEQELVRTAIDKVKSDLEKNNQQETALAKKEVILSGWEAERREKEAEVKALENAQSQNQGE